MTETTRQAGGLAAVLTAHEARWTTHGWDRPYEVIHCVSADCDWSLRQKALMTDEDCYEAHRAHVAAALLDHLRAVAADEGVREVVARSINHVDDEALVRTNFEHLCATYDEQATAALTAFLDHLADGSDGGGAAEIEADEDGRRDIERLRAVAQNAAAVSAAAAAIRQVWSLDAPAEVAHFVDEVDPPTVLTLLDRLAAAEAALGRVEALADEWEALADYVNDPASTTEQRARSRAGVIAAEQLRAALAPQDAAGDGS